MAQQSGQIEMPQDKMDELVDEVLKEKCTIQQTANGEVQRIVAVVALHLCRSDERFLVQLGQCEKDRGVRDALKLPGTKRRMGELPQTAFERILEEDLAPLKSHFTIDDIAHQVDSRHSQKYRMTTLYTRAVHHC